MLPEPHELTQARRAYLRAGEQYLCWSNHVRETGGTDQTREAHEAARSTLRATYIEYLDACATAGVPS